MSQTNRKMRALQKAKQEEQDRRIEAAVEEARKNPRKRDHARNLKIFLIGALLLCLVGGIKFLNDSSHADEAAIAAATVTDAGATITPTGVIVTDLGQGKLCFAPDQHSQDDHPDMLDSGFIFYPGGQVERDAYAVLCQQLAKQGITVVLEQVPFDLAIFEPNTADGTQELVPNIKHWYIGGHSLGGVCAGMYLEQHAPEYQGLILLGSYINTDLSATDLDVISIYGDCDNVIDLESYEANKANLPASFEEHVLKGANHGQFGNYGMQRGDHAATISREEQQAKAVELVAAFIKKHSA